MKVLFIGCHCDDIELGCGGTIFKHKNKWDITCVNLSKSNVSGDLKELRKISINSLKYLGVKKIFHYDLMPSKMQQQDVWEILKNHRADIVFTQYKDEHQDHEILYKASLRAFKEKTSIICYQSSPWSCPFFEANYWEKISKKQLKAKLKAISNYYSVYSDKKYISKKSIKSSAAANGIFIKAKNAECFKIIKIIK